MTQKFIGNIKVFKGPTSLEIAMPTDTSIPPKQEWSKHPIWQFNGKAYKPLTTLAELDLNSAIKQIEAEGFTRATKEGKRKPTSISYAILTTNVEPFYFVR